jgi:hypothetical protein
MQCSATSGRAQADLLLQHRILERHALPIVLGEVSLKVSVKRPWSSATTPRRETEQSSADFRTLQLAWSQAVIRSNSYCDASWYKVPVARPLFKDVSQSEMRIR